MSLFITLTIVVVSVFGILLILTYFEYRFDKRLKMKKEYSRHFLWLRYMGLRESAYIVYPELGLWKDIMI